MVYYTRTKSPAGTLSLDAAPAYKTLSDAMSALCEPLKRGSATDAWVDDHDGVKRADLTAIKRHCGLSN